MSRAIPGFVINSYLKGLPPPPAFSGKESLKSPPFSRGALGIFGFCNEKLRFFGFVVRCGFRFFPFLASGFRFFGKNNAVFRILVTDVDFGFSNLEGRQRRRQTCTGSQCGFCGCVALSTAFKLQFCSYKHVFSDMIGGPKNCFQQRLIFYFRLQFAINFF